MVVMEVCPLDPLQENLLLGVWISGRLSCCPVSAELAVWMVGCPPQDKAHNVLNQRPRCGAVSSVGRIHESRNQCLNVWVAPLNATLYDPVGILCFMCLELWAL